MAEFSINRSAFIKGLRKAAKDVEQSVVRTLQLTTAELQREILSRTPVWSGQAVRNMMWSMGSPSGAELEGIPNNVGTPGTNAMPLGPEPRRGANEAAANETLDRLRFGRPFTRYFLTNNAPHIGMLEEGVLPSPTTSRSPHGMFFVSFNVVLAKLQSGALR